MNMTYKQAMELINTALYMYPYRDDASQRLVAMRGEFRRNGMPRRAQLCVAEVVALRAWIDALQPVDPVYYHEIEMGV
jgi:hypothetical protein